MVVCAGPRYLCFLFHLRPSVVFVLCSSHLFVYPDLFSLFLLSPRYSDARQYSMQIYVQLCLQEAAGRSQLCVTH